MKQDIAEIASVVVPRHFMLVLDDGWWFRHKTDSWRDFKPTLWERRRLDKALWGSGAHLLAHSHPEKQA